MHKKRIPHLRTWLLALLPRLSACFIPQAETLIFIHDDHYGLTVHRKMYSQLADPLASDFLSIGYRAAILRHPGSKLRSSQLRRHSYDATVPYALLYLLGLIAFASNKRAKLFAWTILIKMIGCRYIYSIQPSRLLCQAAHSLGVTIYDLQHGVVTSSDPYYRFCFDPCCEPYLKPSAILFLYKSSYSYWKEKSPPLRLYYLGSPYLADRNHRLDARLPGCTEKHCIIIFSQQVGYGSLWGMGDDVDGKWHQSGVPLCLVDLLVNEPRPIYLIIRLHPLSALTSSDIQQLFERQSISPVHKVRIVCATDEPLPIHLSAASLHVTNHSAVVYEAAEFGVPSIVLSQSAEIQHQFQPLIRAGLVAFSANQPDEFIASIRAVNNACGAAGRVDQMDSLNLYRQSYFESLLEHIGARGARQESLVFKS